MSKSINTKLLILNFVLLTIFILYTAGASTLIESDSLVVILFLIISFVFIFNRLEIDYEIILIIIFWIIVNMGSHTFMNSDQKFKMSTFFGQTMRLIMPYLILKIVGPSFFEKFSKYVYILALISIPFFIIQFINPYILYDLRHFLNFMTQSVHADAGSWYIFIYMFAVWHPERNAGFMWEPGAFAAILIFVISYRLSTNNFRIDKYMFVYLFALITTFSTAGYLALSLIIVAYVKTKVKHWYYLLLLLPIIGILSFQFYMQTDFMSGKIDDYLERGTNTWQSSGGIQRVTRLGIAIVTLDSSLKWPFGNGILENSYKLKKYGTVSGPNSLATILNQWGWIGLVFVLYFIFKFYRGNIDFTTSVLFAISMYIVLFSNPFAFKFLIYSIPFYVLVYRKERKTIIA